MASVDVIELGSSDDEPERTPVPKKAKPKPKPNAMVHIPSKLPGVTIKSSKGIVMNKNEYLTGKKNKAKPGGSSNILQNPFASKIMKKTSNGQSNIGSAITVLRNPIPVFTKGLFNAKKLVNNSAIGLRKVSSLANPINIVNRTGTPTKTLSKVQGGKATTIQGGKTFTTVQGGKTVTTVQGSNTATTVQGGKTVTTVQGGKTVTKVQGQKCLNNLPPGITITKTSQVKRKRPPISMVPSTQLLKKPKLHPLGQVGDVLTVELDDDEISQTSINPLWYIKPEDQATPSSLEEENNSEPEPPKFIEITIEDSPVKPVPYKRAYEIEKDSAITIDDSPVKPVIERNKKNETSTSGSDDDKVSENKTPNSKKKLVYPAETEVCEKNSTDNLPCNANDDQTIQNVIEIEIDPMDVDDAVFLEKNKVVSSVINDNVLEIEDSPVKNPKETNEKTTPKKLDHSKLFSTPSPAKTEKKNVEKVVGEFHPVYQNFIDLCFKLENSDDMKKIVEKKIKAYYRQVPKQYTESEEFVEMVSSKIMSMTAAPDKMYLFIKDVVDELNLQRKIAKSQAANEEKAKELEAAAFYGEEIEQDSKRKRQVRKLEKTLKKLHRAIQKLEDQEVDFDDDGDSVYILTESEDDTTETTTEMDKSKPIERDRKVLLQRYKERLVRVHAKLCQLSNTKMPSEPRVHVEPRPGRAAGPARRLEKWVNRRVPVGTPLPFPDFHDVLRCVREANLEDKLDWNEADIMEEARDLFTRCGKKLQRRRQENEWRIAASRIAGDVDPAEESAELKKKLEDNRKTASLKETEVINKYADRQKQLNLEAVEIGDKEADESPVESGDEAQDEVKNDETKLENSEERKERLKRLLIEKSKNSSTNNTDSDKADEVNYKENKVSENKKDSHKVTNEVDDEENKVSQNKKDSLKVNVEMNDEENKDVITDENNADKEILPDKKTTNEDSNSVATTKDVVHESNNEEIVLTNIEKSVEVELSHKEIELEICAQNDNITNDSAEVQKSGSTDSVLLLSDDSKKVDSDVDELHLLQKLYSGTDFATSTLESSDTDTPIAITDTLESSDDVGNKNKNSSDVVSIENSSYSESECNKEKIEENEMEVDEYEQTECPNDYENEVDMNDAVINSGDTEPKKQNRNSNEEYTKPVEDILLASSEDDSSQGGNAEPITVDSNNGSSDSNEQINCVNLRDDSISIGETEVEGSNKTSQDDNFSETYITDSQESIKEIAPTVSETITNTNEQPEEVLENVVTELENETACETIDSIPDKSVDLDTSDVMMKEPKESFEINKAVPDVGEQSPETAELHREISILCGSESNDS